MSTFVYKVRRRNSSEQNSYDWYYTFGKDYSTEASARKALDTYIFGRVFQRKYESGRYVGLVPKEGEFEKIIAEGFEIVKIEIIRQEVDVTDQSELVNNTLLKNHLVNVNQQFASFWENAMYQGYADKIEFIIQLDIPHGTDRKDGVMEARRGLRNMDIKTRTFREYQGMFGFYNKDQAFAARLTLNGKAFIDITEIRRELFGEPVAPVGPIGSDD